MYKRFIFIFTIGFSLPIWGQISPGLQKSIDSLNLEISRADDPLTKADNYNALGFIYKNNRLYTKATDAFEQALKIFKKEKHQQGLAWTYTYISYTFTEQLQSEEAVEYLKKSQEICLSNHYLSDAANNFIQLGYAYINLFDYKNARESFSAADKIYQNEDNRRGRLEAHRGIGYTYGSQSNYPKAMEMFNRALDFAEMLRDDQLVAVMLLDIAGSLFEQANYNRAIEISNQALEKCESTNYELGKTFAWTTISASLKQQKKYDEALKYIQMIQDKYDEINDHNGMGTVYNNKATIHYERKELDEALKYHLLGLEFNRKVNDRPGTLRSLTNVGMTYFKIGETKKGLEYARESEIELQQLGDLRLHRYNRKLFFEIHDFKKEYDLAEQYMHEMIALNTRSILLNFPALSETEKEFFFKYLEEDYMEFYNFSMKHQARNPAIKGFVYDNVLRNKGLLLKSSTAMRNAILSSGNSILIDQYERWLVLKKQIAEAYSAGQPTKELETSANNLEKELMKTAGIFADVKKVQDLQWTQVRDKLKPDEAAIEFVNYNSFSAIGDPTDTIQYAALIIRHDSEQPEFIKLCAESELTEILGTFGGNNEAYINRVYGTTDEPNTNLSELIWIPMEQYLDGVKSVYYSPSGLLHRVSFSGIATSQNILLCDRYDLRSVSSTGKVVLPDHFEIGEKLTMTLFGGIDYDTPNSKKTIWSYLAGTKTEIENIEKIVQEKQHNIFKGTTEAQFKMYAPKSQIIHLSTHGFFYPDPEDIDLVLEDESETEEDLAFRGGQSFAVETFVKNKNPLMRSGLALSGANAVWNYQPNGTDDGVLTAFEVAQMDLRNTGLVVLSACETGLGDIKGSEGVYGLQRAFKMAGVNQIIMSLWQVPDKETQEFMTLFYKELTKGNQIRAAFNFAQKEMRYKYDTYYWAAFVLIE